MLVDYRAPLELNHWEMGFTEFSPLLIFLFVSAILKVLSSMHKLDQVFLDREIRNKRSTFSTKNGLQCTLLVKTNKN